MKKLIISILLYAMCGSVLAQAQVQVSKNAVISEKIQAKPVYKVKTIDITRDSIVSKDTVKALVKKVDSAVVIIRIQNNTIIDKQDSLVKQKAINESIVNGIKDGTVTFVSLINWLFIIIFIVITWLFNDTVDAKNTTTKLNWFSKIPKILRSFLMGVLIAVIFYWVFGLNSRLDIFSLFCSILTGLIVYKIGIDKLLKYISKKYLGFEFESKTVKPEPVKEEIKPEIKPEQ